jgi:YVTN family beta-propeller protein
VIETLKTGNGPTGLAFDEEETKLFVANAKDNTISVFDLKTNKRLDDIKLPLDLDFPGGIMLMPDRKHLLVSSESTPNVGLIDTKTMMVEKQPDIGQTIDRFLFVPSEN